MYIHGHFYNTQDERIELHILSGTDRSDDIEIGADGSEGYKYEDVLFAPPQLSNDYPVYNDLLKPSSFYDNKPSVVEYSVSIF